MIEWLVGLNPKVIDVSAYPKLTIAKVPGAYRLTFPTLPNRKYQLQASTALSGWAPLGSPLVTAPDASPGTFQMDDADGLGKRFYRMVITPAP